MKFGRSLVVYLAHIPTLINTVLIYIIRKSADCYVTVVAYPPPLLIYSDYCISVCKEQDVTISSMSTEAMEMFSMQCLQAMHGYIFCEVLCIAALFGGVSICTKSCSISLCASTQHACS